MKVKKTVTPCEICIGMVIASVLLYINAAFFGVGVSVPLYSVIIFSFGSYVFCAAEKRSAGALFVVLVFIIASGSLFYAASAKQTVIFVSALCFCETMKVYGIKKWHMSLMYAGCILFTITAAVLYFRPSSWMYGCLVYNYSNPNLSATVLQDVSKFFIVFVLIGCERKRPAMLILSLCAAVFLCFAVWKTDSRTPVIANMLLLLYITARIFIKRTSRLLDFAVVISPILFFVVTVILYRSNISDISVFDESFFSGREKVWYSAMCTLLSDPFGLLTVEQAGLNAFLMAVYNYGIFAAGLYFIYIFSAPAELSEKRKHIISCDAAYFAFLCTFLRQCTESTMITCSNLFYILSFLLLGAAVGQPCEAQPTNYGKR